LKPPMPAATTSSSGFLPWVKVGTITTTLFPAPPVTACTGLSPTPQLGSSGFSKSSVWSRRWYSFPKAGSKPASLPNPIPKPNQSSSPSPLNSGTSSTRFDAFSGYGWVTLSLINLRLVPLTGFMSCPFKRVGVFKSITTELLLQTPVRSSVDSKK